MFHDILEEKNVFLSYKNKKFKKWKNCHFPKGVSSWFWSKSAVFPSFFKGNICQENLFYDIQERKNVFLIFKNKKFQKSKNCLFSTRVSPWFWSKIGHFSKFFLRQYNRGKCVFRYSRTKKRLFRLQKKEVQKVEKLPFFQRG